MYYITVTSDTQRVTNNRLVAMKFYLPYSFFSSMEHMPYLLKKVVNLKQLLLCSKILPCHTEKIYHSLIQATNY